MKRHTSDGALKAFVSPFIDIPADGSQTPTVWLIDKKGGSGLFSELRRFGAPIGEKFKPAYIVPYDFSFDTNDYLTFWDTP